MLVVLDIRYSLCKVAVRANSRRVEAVLDFAQELFNHWNPVLADYDTLHFQWFDLTVPFVVSNVSDGKSLDRVSIKDFLNKFF